MSAGLQALVGVKMLAVDFERMMRVLAFVAGRPDASIRAVLEDGPVGTLREAKSLVTKLARHGCLEQGTKLLTLDAKPPLKASNRQGTGKYYITLKGDAILCALAAEKKAKSEHGPGSMQGRGAA